MSPEKTSSPEKKSPQDRFLELINEGIILGAFFLNNQFEIYSGTGRRILFDLSINPDKESFHTATVITEDIFWRGKDNSYHGKNNVTSIRLSGIENKYTGIVDIFSGKAEKSTEIAAAIETVEGSKITWDSEDLFARLFPSMKVKLVEIFEKQDSDRLLEEINGTIAPFLASFRQKEKSLDIQDY
jgi:hypothetical protein